MRLKRLVGSIAILAVTASAQAPAGPQQNPPAPAAAQKPSQQSSTTGQQPASAVPLKTNTRLIAVDVVATDSKGNPVRGLKADDFEVSEEHSGRQTITQFQFIDASSQAAPAYPPGLAAPSPATPYLYSNLLPQKMRVPPTVMLMDALNTQIEHQVEVRRHMLMLLKTLPADTPIAVFILGHQLHVAQNFTTDPAVLRAALDKVLRPPDIAQDSRDDPNSASAGMVDLNKGQENQASQALEDFEKETFAAQMSLRVDETTDAMVAIAKYLGGYPGRKNLLWFSEAFPTWLQPDTEFGRDPFQGTADFGDKIRKATEALTDARVAVYPVDARGLQANSLYSTAQDPRMSRTNPGASLAGNISRDNTARIDSQAAMEMFADESGGKVCSNTNDLSGCVQAALDDGSVYYVLGYYPEGTKWDGRFHKISVKTRQKGVKLRYRDGYFALELGLGEQSAAQLLQRACQAPLPPTSIPMTAESLAPNQGNENPGEARYLLTIAPSSLTLSPSGPDRRLSLQMAVCEFDPSGESFRFFPRDLSAPVPDAVYQSWQNNGIRNVFDYAAKPENQRLRFAVLDVPSGTTGAIDVPAHPTQFGALPAPTRTNAAAAPPATAPASSPPIHIKFGGSNGESSMLDWVGDSVSYHGDLSVDLGARALYGSLFGAKYHCDEGSLVANDPAAAAKPNLVLTLRKPDGRSAVIDLGADAPAYSGDVPVDPSGRAFFDNLWKLCHCQQP